MLYYTRRQTLDYTRHDLHEFKQEDFQTGIWIDTFSLIRESLGGVHLFIPKPELVAVPIVVTFSQLYGQA